MRIKDDEKRDALVRATIKLVNQVGFAASSVSKIAKEAGVSSSTLYIYFKNKEDLLISTYVDIKLELSAAMLEGFDRTKPIRDIFRTFCFNSFYHMAKYPESAAYIEQFSASPYVALVDKAELEEGFKPLMAMLETGIKQKIIKDVNHAFIGAFMFVPVSKLATTGFGCDGEKCDDKDIDTVFNMAWDAIKL